MSALSIMADELPFLALSRLRMTPVNNQEMIKQRQIKNTIPINGVVAMKIGMPCLGKFQFWFELPCQASLLSKDGSKLIVEKDISGGSSFFIHRTNHRLVGEGGSGQCRGYFTGWEMLGIISADYIMQIFKVRDGSLNQCIALPEISHVIMVL